MAPKKGTKKKLAPKERVFAKMSGYPQWPAFITPPEMIPKGVLKHKKKSTDYCVMFIPDGDFYWMSDKSLEILTPEKLEKALKDVPNDVKKNVKNKKKTGKQSNIKEAIAATDGLDFDTFIRNVLKGNEDDDEDEDDEDDDAVEPKEDEREEEGEDEEEEEEDEEAPADGENESDEAEKEEENDEAEKKGTEKTAVNPRTKRARNGNSKVKHEADEPPAKRKRPSTPVAKPETNGKDGKIKAETPKPISDEEKQHQLWLCRIKLQRSLIQRNQPTTPKDTSGLKPPTADELSVARLILYRLIEFPINVDLLRKTKIHKVLKCILKDESLAYPDSFKLHERCQELLSKWDTVIQSLKLEKSAKDYSNTSSPSIANFKNGDKPKSSQMTQDDSEVSGIEHSLVDKKDTDGDDSEEPPQEEEKPEKINSSLENANDVPVTSVEG
ncbi:vesicle coat complex AP-3 [Scheffersomyces xylosifermentans]|uniref:vesicle coat complex AP-3 n=1 Tax=Scheffersomyces xylosifermentans TaxID=1304137 RepID=UPI00315DCE16